MRDNLTATKPLPILQQLQPPHNDTLSCTGRIQHPVTQEKHKVNILLDSGNSIQSCAVISFRCANDLNLKILPHKTTIGTADSSNPMVSQGKIQQLDLLLPNQSIPVTLQNVTVLPKLNGDINLGANFLRTHKGTLTWTSGNPVLQLQRADLQATTPILLQMTRMTTPRPAPIAQVLGAKLTGQIKAKINKDFLVETNTARTIRMTVQGLPEDASIYLPLQDLGGVETVEGINRTAKRNTESTFEILFINTQNEDKWVRAQNAYVELYTCDDRGVNYPHKEKPKLSAYINQINYCLERQKEILKELKIEENKFLTEHLKIKAKTTALITKYADVFTPKSEGKVGVTDLVTMELKMKPGPAIRQKVRPLNPAMKSSLDEQIADWIENSVITNSVSEFSSPLVPVKKKDGKVRWCVDFRAVNDRIVSDSFPIPNIEDLVQKAAGNRVYSALDCFAAYNHIRVAPDSRKYTAFSMPDGHYEFLRMLFGLKTAVSVYSRFVAMAMSGISPEHIGIYLDDMLLYTQDAQQHLKVLEQILQRHREAGLMLKPSKTFLFQTKVQYLGHMLSEQGIEMVPNYLEKILTWPSPRNRRELIHMLGLFGYYRAFIPKFAQLTNSMNAVRGEKTEFSWTQ